jgi:hypothetical protein
MRNISCKITVLNKKKTTEERRATISVVQKLCIYCTRKCGLASVFIFQFYHTICSK